MCVQEKSYADCSLACTTRDALCMVKDPASAEYRPPDAFFADAEEVVLQEGAMLYHPAGIWHHVECLGEACRRVAASVGRHRATPPAEEESISINVSLSCATWADLVAQLPKAGSRLAVLQALEAPRLAMRCARLSGLLPIFENPSLA